MTRLIDGRSRRQKVWQAVVPLYPTVRRLYGDVDPNGWDGRGRRASWYASLRQVGIGYSITTRAMHRDQGTPYEGWNLTLYLGPVTVDVHGADAVEDDDS